MSDIKTYGYIVNRQFKVNKKRNISTILGIILSIILFTTIGYISNYYRDISILDAKAREGNFEAILSNISKEDVKTLEHNIFVEKVGLYNKIYETRVKFGDIEKSIKLYSVDNIVLQDLFSPIIEIDEGDFPKNDYEIIIDNVGQYYLNKNIGDTLELDDKEYKIVGIYKKINASDPYSIEIITYLNRENIKEKVSAAFTVSSNRNKDKVIRKVAANLGISNEDKTINEGEKSLIFNEVLLYSYGVESINYNYSINKARNIEFILYGIILVLTTFLSYGSINVSIKERVQQFSILRCIGATTSKIRLILIKESFFLGLFSLIPGIIIGQLICFFISGVVLNKIIGINNYGLIYIVYFNVIVKVLLLTIMNILMATMIPIIKVSYISPIKAVKTGTVFTKEIKRRNSKVIRKLFGYDGELAYKNIRANNRTFIITTITSIILLTTFIVFTGYNYNLIKVYNKQGKESKDVVLDIGVKYQEPYENIFEELENYKKDIEQLGVTKKIFSRLSYSAIGIFEDVKLNKWIKEKEGEYSFGENRVEVDGSEGVYSNNINLLILDDDALNEILTLIEGDETLSLEDFKENGVIISDRIVVKNFIDVSKEPLFNLKKGDKFTLAMKEQIISSGKITVKDEIKYIKNNSNEISLKYLGDIDGNSIFDGGRYGFLNSTTLIVSKDFYYNNKDLLLIKPNSLNFVLELKDYVNKDMVLQTIENYSNRVEGEFLDVEGSNKELKSNMMILSIIIYIILFLTIVIGGINIINNKNINIKLRGKEIGTLLALGISKKRLKKILLLEGIVQWIISSVISVMLSYVILKIIYEVLYYTSGINSERIPIVAVIVGCGVLFIVNVIGSYLPIRKLKYINTLELIRNNE